MTEQEIIDFSNSDLVVGIVDVLKAEIKKYEDAPLDAKEVFNDLMFKLNNKGLTINCVIESEFYLGMVMTRELLESDYFVKKHLVGFDVTNIKNYITELLELILKQIS